MILRQKDSYIKACMKTWMFCEACINSEKNNDSSKEILIDKCSACADSCLMLVCKIINDPIFLEGYAFNCLIDCRECFEECQKYKDDDDIRHCGDICWLCAGVLKYLVFSSNLN